MRPLRVDLSSAAHASDPLPSYNALRAAGAVARVRLPILGPLWMTTNYAAAAQMLKDSDLFARDPIRAGRKPAAHLRWWMPRSLLAVADNMLMYDGADHKRLRGAVEYAFARRDLRQQEAAIAEMARAQLDLMPHGEPFDFHATVSRPYPLAVITEMLGLTSFGSSAASRDVEAVSQINSAFGIVAAARKLRALRRLFEAEIETARRTPGSGLLRHLTHPEGDQAQLSDRELVSMIFMLYFAGHETTVHLINACGIALCRKPAWQDALRSQPDRTPLFVEEALRHHTPLQFTKPRFVTQDMEFHGTWLRRGDQIFAHLGLANRDPSKYPDPDRFDPSRKPNPHLSFGAGIHFCLGVQLARLETVTLINQLLARGQISLASDVPWRPRIGIRGVKALPLVLD